MVFGHRQPIVRDPVGADGRALHDIGNVAVGAHTTEGIGPGETEHIDHGVEALCLERALERCPLAPIAPYEACPRGNRTTHTAIKTGDLMALCQQDAHDTRTDMPCSPNDTDSHPVATPSAHYITIGQCSKSGDDVVTQRSY